MVLTEYDPKRHERNVYAEGRADGMIQGIAQGLSQGIAQGITKGREEMCMIALENGMELEDAVKFFGMSREELMRIYTEANK